MYLDSWSIALILVNLLDLFLVLAAARTAFRVLRFWDPNSDASLQITLENETWLASTLVQYGLFFQVVSLVLLVVAADSFSNVLPGAMGATGSLRDNVYGFPLLWLKIAGVFLYGFWILLHHLDIQVESYPLVRIKFAYLFFLLPLLVADTVVEILYIGGLDPEIITSCCGVVFSDSGGAGGGGLMMNTPAILGTVFYSLAALMALLNIVIFLATRKGLPGRPARFIIYGSTIGWLAFGWAALAAIITIFSSYIYSMPYHHCPFCILKPEYHYIGYLIYFTLFPAIFFGIGQALAQVFSRREGLAEISRRFISRSALVSLVSLILFVLTVTTPMLLYLVRGGE